jgi:excisionase family DNA binding protein
MKPLHNVYSAARLLSISPWTVRSYIHNGKLKPVRLGRRVLLAEDELERFVASCKAAANEASHNDPKPASTGAAL